MKTRSWADVSAPVRADPEKRAMIEEYKRAIYDALALSQLRTERGYTQERVASAMNISQTRVSRLERQDDLYLSTLREYVSALGGQLHVTAEFGDQTIELACAGD